jgi:valyl-tRNA synthetase
MTRLLEPEGAEDRTGVDTRHGVGFFSPRQSKTTMIENRYHPAEVEPCWVVDLITAIRSVRVEMNIPAATPLPAVLAGASPRTVVRARRWPEFAQRLARRSDISFADAVPKGALQLVVRGDMAALPLAGLIDVAAERARLNKELAKCDADIARVEQKLKNPDFVKRAPEAVVEGEREKRGEALVRKQKIIEALARLKESE